MKIRCKKCGRVSNVDWHMETASCPACGAELTHSQPAISHVQDSSTEGRGVGKGELPTVDESTRSLGCLVMGILLIGVPIFIAIIFGGDNVTYWVLAIIALICLIPLGVWFEKKTIRRK